MSQLIRDTQLQLQAWLKMQFFFLLLTNVSFHFITKTKADSSKTGGHSRLFIIQTVENGAFVLDSFNPSAIPAYSSWVE